LAHLSHPQRLFDGEKPLALDEGAFDLAVIYGGVDRSPHVHLDVDTQHLMLARQEVNLYLGYLGKTENGSAKRSPRGKSRF
jgi:hypothetical protein